MVIQSVIGGCGSIAASIIGLVHNQTDGRGGGETIGVSRHHGGVVTSRHGGHTRTLVVNIIVTARLRGCVRVGERVLVLEGNLLRD